MSASVPVQPIRSAIVLQVIIFCVGLLACVGSAAQETVFTYRSPVGEDDDRNRYQLALLTLALEKTKQEYGEFTLVPSGSMNNTRAIEALRKKGRENFVFKLSYDSEYPDFMDYVRFPIDLGIVGYRICFISPKAKAKLSASPTLEELIKLSHVQGKGWIDVKILRHNGFQVNEVSNYEGKFHTVALNRHDLFCRGINELHEEYEKFRAVVDGLDFDRTFVLVYPLPRFFYTHKDNREAIERVTKGIMQAYADGSLMALWLEAYGHSIQFSDFRNRKVIELENPAVQGIDFDYQQFFYHVEKIR